MAAQKKSVIQKMSSPRSVAWLIAFGFLVTSASVARSDEWVKCKRDGSTGQLVWIRGKSTQPLKNPVFRPDDTNPNLGKCLVSHAQLRQAHGLKF